MATKADCICGTLMHLGTGRTMTDLNAYCPQHGHLPPESKTDRQLAELLCDIAYGLEDEDDQAILRESARRLRATDTHGEDG